MAQKVVGLLVTYVALAAIGFGSVKVIGAVKRKATDDQFAKACADARQVGLPLVHADLVKQLGIKPEDDATDLLKQMGVALNAIPLQDPQTRNNYDDTVIAASTEQNTELLGLCAQATSGNKVPALGKFTSDIFGTFPSIKGTIRRLTMASTAEARRGQWDLVKRNLGWSAKLCDMGTEPPFRTLAEETTESKIYYYGSLLQMLIDGKGSPAVVSFVQEQLKTNLKEPRLERLWGGDLVMRVTEFESTVGQGLQADDPVVADNEVWVYPPADPWKRRAVLSDVIKSYTQINQEVTKSKDLLSQVEAGSKVVKDQVKTVDHVINGFILNDELMSALCNGIRSYMVDRNLATIAAYVFDFRNKNGKYPSTLKGSPVAGLTDPFGGQDMRYTVLNSGFMVYSIGPNLKDDGGLGKQGWGGSAEHGDDDLSFRFGS